MAVSVAEILTTLVKNEVNLIINLKQEANTFRSKLENVKKGLEDAERRGVTESNDKQRLKQVTDVIHDMDDVLDEWETAKLQVEVSRLGEKVRFFVLSLCLCFKQVVDQREITIKMKDLSDKIDKILRERENYNFLWSEEDRSGYFEQGPSTSLVNEFMVYGRDPDRDSLIEKLLSEGEGSDDGTQVISIVGIMGVGKTTLAQLAYNHGLVYKHFAPRAWVSVSEPFDVSAIARAILEAFGESSAGAHSLETLFTRIEKAVLNKRFLLVLDNVWLEDHMTWVYLKRCLHGARGSRILVTTRSQLAARMMGTTQWQPIGLLSDLDCGTILNGIALEGRTRKECERLRDFGVAIAKKCNGLPLAASSVGGMLALRSTEQEWRAVQKTPLWTYIDKVRDLFHRLNLSYTNLSLLLRRCFLSSVIFQKGTLINVEKIIRIWMAYGYLSSKGSVDEVLLKGLEYMEYLALRSFFQKLENDEEDRDMISYRMHHIMHDFAKFLSSDEYSLVVDGRVEKEEALRNFPANSLGRLCTFCVRHLSQLELPLNLFRLLRSVRVLSMCDCNLEVLPEEVGNLIHLRFLDLSGNPIRELPEAVTDLCNLQTLSLEKCRRLSSLPQGIEKLVSLRYLLNSETCNLFQFPNGLEKLTGLWTLSEFRGGKLRYLRNLNQLQGSISLSLDGLNESADSLEEVRGANLGNKKHIKGLTLDFCRVEQTDAVVDALQPPPNLQTLVMHGNTGKWLSNWIFHKSFDNLKVVQFFGKGKCSDLPAFGKLPALEVLVISDCRFKSLSVEFMGVEDVTKGAKGLSRTQSAIRPPSSERVGWFPRLKKLCFLRCGRWQEWEDIKEEARHHSVPMMACLEELEITSCPELRALPGNLLRRATSLKILNLSDLSLSDRYNKVSGYEQGEAPHHVKFSPDSQSEAIRVSFMGYTDALRFSESHLQP